MTGDSRRIPVLLALFAVLYGSLAVASYVRKSATWDEPQQLLSGYAMLKMSDYTLDMEHPPLLRKWAALPLLLMPDVVLDTGSPSQRGENVFGLGPKFLFLDNDVDRLLHPARLMIVLLGLLLGGLLFSWAYEVFGFTAAAAALLLYLSEPNLIAHARLVTTDLGVACVLFGATYFLWRLSRRASAANMAGTMVFSSLSVVSKFSGLAVLPIAGIILGWRALRSGDWPATFLRRPCRSRLERVLFAGALTAILALSCLFTVWASYGFRYGPSQDAASGSGTRTLSSDPLLRDSAPLLAGAAAWSNRHRLLPEAYTEGFLASYKMARERPAYLMGKYSRKGWWYYFPVAFLVKTQVAVLLLFLFGLVAGCSAGRGTGDLALHVVTAVSILIAGAMMAHLNIGLRHFLPVYPFVLLICSAGIARLLRSRAGSAVLAVLLAAALAESLAVFPDYLAFFNRAAGGPSRGHEYLLDSNLDWGQDLKLLKRWMDREGVGHVNLSYFGSAYPEKYGIEATGLFGNNAPYPRERPQRPRLPGYVAVSATNLYGVYFNEAGRNLYRHLRESVPVARPGYSIFVYYVERPWY